MVRAEEPHHLGVTSLGGETIQLWWSERRNHITLVLPVWVETPFSCDGQDGGSTLPGCCQSGWRDHSVVMARTEKPPSPGSCQSYWKIEEVEPTNHTLKFEEMEPVILEYMGKRGNGTSHWWHGTLDSLFFDRCHWPHVLCVLDLKAVTGTWTHLLELSWWAVWDIDGFLWNPPFPGILVTQGKWEIMRLIRNCRGSSNHQTHGCLLNRLFRRRSKKHQRSASLVFVWGIHRDRLIPRTKGQLRGKCFHLMTSPCNTRNCRSVIWPFCRYSESRQDDETVVGPSYLYNGNPYDIVEG